MSRAHPAGGKGGILFPVVPPHTSHFLGTAYREMREKDHAIRRYMKPLERLGQKVDLEPVASRGIFCSVDPHCLTRKYLYKIRSQ